MKILLIQQYLGRKELPVMPVGLGYIASVVPEHDVKLVDMNNYPKPYEQLEKVIADFTPDIIGISIRNIDNQQRSDLYYYYLEFPKSIKIIKKLAPQAKIVLGGAGFSMFPRKIMERNPDVHFGVYLEGEVTFPKLLKNLDNPSCVSNLYYRKGDEVIFTEKAAMLDLSELKKPRKDVLDMDFYKKHKWAVGVNTKRGCPARCAYCNYYTLNGMRVRTVPAQQVVDEIEELVNVYKVESFLFADGLFSAPYKHVKEICDEIKKRNIKVEWGAWCGVRDVTTTFLDTVSEAGCTLVVLSPDAFSDEALKGLHKGFSNKDVRESIKRVSAYPGVKLGFGFFNTPPNETVLGYFKTLFYYFPTVFMLMLRRKGGAGFSWIRIEPETPIYKISLEQGLLNEDDDLLPDTTEKLSKMFYVNPKLKFLDPLARFLGSVMQLKKLFRPRIKE